MSKILVIKSSILGQNSVSNELIERFLSQLPVELSSAETVIRDLGSNPLPLMDARQLGALNAVAGERNPEQQRMLEISDSLVEELRQADLVLIGAPMYNFGVPAGLKTWIDHIARAGVTFKYTEQGAQGLLTGKTAVVFTAMGGVHQPGETDHLRPYLKTVLNFIGLDDIEFVAATGLNLGEEPRQRGLRAARERLIAVADSVGSRLLQGNSSRKVA